MNNGLRGSHARHEEVNHGGNTMAASLRYDIPPEDWVDLSSATNPQPYPLSPIDPRAFQQLPYLSPALVENAAAFYGGTDPLPVPGTQVAIQNLPQCLAPHPMLVPQTGYQEHAHQWRIAGGEVHTYPAFDIAEAEKAIGAAIEKNSQRHIVIINPNNPTGLRFQPQRLLQWARRLGPDSYLIVDEAFMDTSPAESVLQRYFSNNMIVLRSFGKFFGLAGLRLGFVFADQSMLNRLRQRVGPWAVNGPAQAIAINALKDKDWAEEARVRIGVAANFTQRLFTPLLRVVEPLQTRHEMLFSSYLLEDSSARKIQHFFSQRGILLRLIKVNAQQSVLRIGLLDESRVEDVSRVEQAVIGYKD